MKNPRLLLGMPHRETLYVSGGTTFPYATTRARACDLDHTIPWRADGPPGQTRPSRLGPLSRREHRAKTHGGWQLEQPAPGVFHWRSPGGYHYRVGRIGTRPKPDDPLGQMMWNIF